MAYTRPYGQAQSASPWSAGVPPGLQQHPQQQAQQMFNQPMGAFDLSGAWQGQQPTGQWAPQPMQPMQPPVQFVSNPNAFMQQQQPPPQQQQQRYHNQQQQQRPMHQRSLSAPRTGANGLNKRANQNNSFGNGGGGGGGNGGSQWQQRQNNNNNNNSNNNNNNNVHQQRAARQQSRQKVQFSNNNNSNSNNNANNRQQNQPKQQGQQQQQQQQPSKKGTVKLTKVVKKQALRVKQGDAKAKSADSTSTNDKANDGVSATTTNAAAAAAAATDEGQKSSSDRQVSKPQSKTAERKQFKLQARKNAEAVKHKKLPVAKSSSESAKAAAADGPGAEMKVDEGAPIDQAQLKCVPAVFGFVCKCCDVFLRDRFSRREHIDSDEHMQKFKTYEEEQQRLKEESSKDVEESSKDVEEPSKGVEESSKDVEEPANNLTAESSEAEKKSTQEGDQESSRVEPIDISNQS